MKKCLSASIILIYRPKSSIILIPQNRLSSSSIAAQKFSHRLLLKNFQLLVVSEDDNNLRAGKHVFDMDLSSDHVSKTLAGTELYTVSNSDNEFVLISDPNGLKSIGLLCFRKEDADVFLAQVRLRKGELRGRAKVVPIALDQVIAYLQVSTIKRIVGKRLLPRNCLQTVYRRRKKR
ncbi:hypothetical protein L6452_16750 [Arctium lappa]|uniref:Uncharacterized protein n=1 Tax=Arctium lappa TaxID=4217 RepID=A0ACB9C1M9_ARCLA|nr:hypothetical protein L6452_16750 [Arctium lappa]